MFKPSLRALLLASLVLGLAAGCRGRSVLLQSTTPVALANAADPTELRAALVRALQARRFTTEEDQPGRIVASFTHRSQQMRIAIAYGPTNYTIQYVDSAGMGYVVGPDGAARISRNYDRHLTRLRRSIDEEIARPERERQEAIEEQRQHEQRLAEQARQAEEDRMNHERRLAEDARRAEQDRIDAAHRRQQDARNAEVEMQRLRTQQAQAEADANRPVIINHQPEVVTSLQVAPRRRVQARFGTVRVTSRTGARWLNGEAQGNMSGGELGIPGGCRGYFSGRAEHVITVPRGLDYLRLETDGQGDPTLVVVASDGSVYCDDDGGEGLNSRIEGSFPAGSYRVFVGSYRANESVPYRLLVSREQARTQAPVAAQPSGPDPSACRQAVLSRGWPASAIRHCRNAEPTCAAELISRGWNPSGLTNCQGVEPSCARTLLQRGWNPSGLTNCRGVDPGCAQSLLDNGNNPSQLQHCR